MIFGLRIYYTQRRNLILTYTLSIGRTVPSKPYININASWTGYDEKKILTLNAPIQDEYIQIDDIEIDRGFGKLKLEVNTKKRNDRFWTVTDYILRTTEQNIGLNYRPKIGIKEGNYHQGFSGLKFGYIDHNFGIVSGYNLFLFPKNGISKSDKIRVRILNHTGQPIYVPWLKKGDFYYPSIKGKYKLKSLLRSSIVWGDFFCTQLTFKNNNFKLFISNLIAPDVQKDITEKAKIIIENVVKIFSPTGLDEISIHFLPKTPDGYDIFTKSWSNNLAMTMFPPTNTRWKKFTEQLLNIYLQHKPTRKNIYREEDYWLIDGLRYYYEDKSLSWINRINFNKLVKTYKTKLIDSDHEIVFSNRFSHEINFLIELYNFKMKSTFVLNEVNDMISQASNNKKNLDTFILYYFKKNERHNFVELFSKYVGSEVFNEKLLKYVTKKVFQEDTASEAINVNNKKNKTITKFNIPPHDKKLKLLHMAQNFNYLENCGCKVNQNGGMARLVTVIKEKRNQNNNLILLNLGDNIPHEKFEMKLTELTQKEVLTGFKIFNEIRFDVFNVSFSEMLYTPEYFLSLLDKIPLPYINSNIKMNGKNILPSYKIININNMKIGIFGISSDQYYRAKPGRFEDSIYFTKYENPVKVIKHIVDVLKTLEKVDLIAMMCNFERTELETIIKDQNIDLILTSVLADVNSQNFGQTYFIDSTLVVRSDFGSYGLIETDIYLKKNKIVAANSKAIEFNEKIKEDVKTRQFINKFYLSVAQQVKDFREIHLWEKQAEKVGFVGAQNCIDCHELQYNQWKITAHATSYHTLTKRHRNYYPNCVQCHVTAFDFKPGFSLSKINDKTFQNVQCEMCHGPGSQHITDPMSKSLLRNPTYEYCVQCHTNDHSDLTKLNFSEYYKKVAH